MMPGAELGRGAISATVLSIAFAVGMANALPKTHSAFDGGSVRGDSGREAGSTSAGPPQPGRLGRSPAPSATLSEDKGRFRIVVDGQAVGTEEFQIALSGGEWVARGRVEVNARGGGPGKFTALLDLKPDGTPTHYEWASQGQERRSIEVDFAGTTAKMALSKGGGQPFVQQFSFPSPRVVILDNNVYHHFALLAQLYDWNARGSQNFAVLIPQDQLPGTITVESQGAAAAGETGLELLKVHSTDLELNLYVDSRHRLMRLDVPSSKAEIIRE